MPRWLVTGGSGFLGRHLCDRLARGGAGDVEVIVSGRSGHPTRPGESAVRWDLDEPAGVVGAIAEARPDVVIHLAGRTPPVDARSAYRVNSAATVALIEALKKAGRPCRLVLAGSAAELGPVEEEALPVGEDHPCRPVGEYALSKWFASAFAMRHARPVEAVVARIFNPIGPGMSPRQAFGRFAALLARPGDDPARLRVGGLEARRDFIDVRDVADALIALANRGEAGAVYHVGTGRSRSVGEGLGLLIGLSGRRVEVEPDGSAATSRGPRDSRAEIARIVAATGWAPRIAFERSIADLWAEAIHRGGEPPPRDRPEGTVGSKGARRLALPDGARSV